MSGAITKTYVDADWASGFTPPLALNWRGGVVAFQLTITGTVNLDIESSNSDLNAGATSSFLVDNATNAGVAASKWITFDGIPRFIRFKVNSGSGSITVRTAQSDV